MLEVEKGAEPAEIKKAYRRLARKHHPDLNKDDQKAAEERFKEISEAYEVLADDDKRKMYDQYGHAGVSGAFGGGEFSWNDFSHYGDFEDLFRGSSFFSNLDSIFSAFGFSGMGGRGRVREPRGNDIRFHMEVDLNEAATGLEKEIEVPRHVRCEKCSGSGAEPGHPPKTCPDCGGHGQARREQRTPFGQIVSVSTCPRCRGSGSFIEHRCKECSGSGLVRKTAHLKVKIPKGVDDGVHLRLHGEGEAASAVGGGGRGRPGDLYVVVHVKDHPKFTREGPHLKQHAVVGYPDLVLGTEIRVPTLDGKAKLKVPAGTAPGQIFRMRGQGMPRMGRSDLRGDMFVEVDLKMPKKLSRKEKKLLHELKEIEGMGE